MNTDTLKAYQCDDSDLYAARDAEEAKRLWHENVGDDETMDDEYPHELTDDELDHRYPEFDEDERPIPGETISVREMLAQHGTEPGWLAGSDW
jgi:hypothetical protein